MFTIERITQEARTLPILSKAGIAVMLLGGLADLMAHLEAAGHDGHLHAHTSAELSAHLIVFVGMVLIYLGVVLDGARRHRARRSSERT
ncbi:MAG TPA: hypothetical protein VFI69_04710 [Candidatus Limnocylindrales bacterium]|nr:hypothetical protein [Candidatus Limnocylindrales bacterium]